MQVILACDDAVPGKLRTDEYSEYRRTGDEAHLCLTGEPTRYEIRGLSVRERLWVQGEIDKTLRDGGSQYLWALAYCRAALCGHDDERRPLLGMQLLPDEAVWGALGRDETAILFLGLIIYSENIVGDSLGKESPSPPTAQTENPTPAG